MIFKKFKADTRSSPLRYNQLLHLPLLQKNLAGIVNANQDYMRYVSYLNPVIETNVTVERLVIFKKKILRPGKRLSEQACKNAEYHRR